MISISILRVMKVIRFRFGLFLQALLVCFLLSCQSQGTKHTFMEDRRLKMVDRQLQSRGISNHRVLEAFRKVERHRFVLPRDTANAYEDYPLSIGYGQTISQPYIVAFMTEAIHPDKNMKVLEIGTGSGYQAAILAELSGEVYSVELIGELAKRAAQTLNELGYEQVHIMIGDGYLGWPEHAPYDAILVTCAPSHIPQPLIDQMAENGRMIIPVGQDSYNQELVILRKTHGKLRQEESLPVRFVPMMTPEGKTY